MRELIAQAEALEWAHDMMNRCRGGEVMERAAQLRAHAEQPAEGPVAWQIWLLEPLDVYRKKGEAEAEIERRNNRWPDLRRKLVPLYAHPDPRIAALEAELLTSIARMRTAIHMLDAGNTKGQVRLWLDGYCNTDMTEKQK